MKSTHLALTAICCTLTLVASSCKKKEEPKTPITSLEKTAAIQALNAIKPSPQNFKVAAGSSQRIFGAEGTRITFYPNSFKDKNGNIITTGNISIQLVEMYHPGDMVIGRAATQTDSAVLTSGGEVNITATMNGEKVFANKYGLGFKTVGYQNKPMELYYGNANNTDSVTTFSTANSGVGQFVQNSSLVVDSGTLRETFYYLFDSCTSFEIVNCDHPYNSSSAFVKINIAIPGLQSNVSYAQLSLCYTTLNAVIMLKSLAYDSSSGTLQFGGYAPTDIDGKFVLMIAKSMTEFYYTEQTARAADGMTLSIGSPALLTLSEIRTKLKAIR